MHKIHADTLGYEFDDSHIAEFAKLFPEGMEITVDNLMTLVDYGFDVELLIHGIVGPSFDPLAKIIIQISGGCSVFEIVRNIMYTDEECERTAVTPDERNERLYDSPELEHLSYCYRYSMNALIKLFIMYLEQEENECY